jgi:hypothetical protein
MQLFGDRDALTFVRISRLNLIGHVNRKERVEEIYVFNNNAQGYRTRGRLKKQTVELCNNRY